MCTVAWSDVTPSQLHLDISSSVAWSDVTPSQLLPDVNLVVLHGLMLHHLNYT